MNFAFKIAWKYFRGRRKSLARLTATAAIVGIAGGVASLILAQALARGFRAGMQEKILGNTAHISVFQTDGEKILNWQAIKKEVENLENVREVLPTSYESALLVGGNSTNYCVLRVVRNLGFGVQNSEFGVQGSGFDSQTSDKSAIRNPQSAIEISIGAELAEKTGLKIGDEAEIILPASQSAIAPKTAPVKIENIFRTGLYDYDSTWIYIAPADLAKLADEPVFTPAVLSVSVKDIYAADKTAAAIRKFLPPDFKVLDWQEANRPLFAALSLEKKAALAIISLIIFIAVLNITTTLALLVNERRLDIAIFRTCGAKTRSLISIFLFEGLLLSLIGIFSGIILGLTGCFVANYFRLVSLPADVYSLSEIRLISNFGDVFLTAAIAFILSLTAAIYPARRAARIKPLENLRNS
ncbi:MAG: ABC transporter permease [Pyrinomonadaceae bacterium]